MREGEDYDEWVSTNGMLYERTSYAKQAPLSLVEKFPVYSGDGPATPCHAPNSCLHQRSRQSHGSLPEALFELLLRLLPALRKVRS